ncbi:unnamed protein product [Sphagnum troendelagicum]|uniref:Uncharacterized protein n=1 Tax=Sphagnum troendelagicum TaxID=128251 RepID=A0ABP0ULG8_9BRYO
MVNLQPLSLWTVKKGEAESNEAEGRPNGITPTGTWRYGMRVPLSSGELIAKHNLPFRPPTQMLPSSLCTPELIEEFISRKRKSLGTATSRSNIMYMLSNSQVAVCRSGTPPRPMSSLQQADPAGSNAACVPSWAGGQRVASGAGEAVSKHSQLGVPLNRNAVFSTSSEVGSGKASRHPSRASSSTVLYPQVHSSSAFDNPQVSSFSPAGRSNVPSSTTVRYMRQQHSYTVPSSSTAGYCNVRSSSMVRYTQQQHSSGIPSSSSRGYTNFCSPATVLYMQQQQSPPVRTPVVMNSSTVWYPQINSFSQVQYSEQPVQVQQSRSIGSSFEMRWTGLFRCLARAYALLGEENGGDM